MSRLLDLGHPEPPPVSIDEAVQIINELSQIIMGMGITDEDEARHNVNETLIRAQAWVFDATFKYI
jgi:uncharacterized membrane protein